MIGRGVRVGGSRGGDVGVGGDDVFEYILATARVIFCVTLAREERKKPVFVVVVIIFFCSKTNLEMSSLF